MGRSQWTTRCFKGSTVIWQLTTSAPSKLYSFYPNLMNVLTITSGVTHFALPPTWTSNPIPCTLLSIAKVRAWHQVGFMWSTRLWYNYTTMERLNNWSSQFRVTKGIYTGVRNWVWTLTSMQHQQPTTTTGQNFWGCQVFRSLSWDCEFWVALTHTHFTVCWWYTTDLSRKEYCTILIIRTPPNFWEKTIIYIPNQFVHIKINLLFQ